MKIEDVVFLGEADEYGFVKLKVASGQFSGTMFTLGKVTFIEESEPTLQYEITYLNERPEDFKLFEREVGDFIIKLLERQIKEGEVVYSGGTD